MRDAQIKAQDRSQFLNRNVPTPVVPPIEDLKPASEGYEPPPGLDEKAERESEDAEGITTEIQGDYPEVDEERDLEGDGDDGN